MIGKIIKYAARAAGIWGYLTKDDILMILMILITGLQIVYDYIKNRKPCARAQP